MKKKTMMVISFTLGALLFATTAIADIVNKNGYDQLKDAIKITAEKCSEEYESYTMDFSVEVKNNGKILFAENQISRNDLVNGASENISQADNVHGKSNMYYYTDRTTHIRKGNDDETYYVTEFSEEREIHQMENPFNDEQAKDIERIVDALVGNLKDHVVVAENPDGSKELSGALTEVQIPALVNAVASFQMKQMSSGHADLPHFTEDIYIKEVSGEAFVNEEGVLESILGKGIVSGIDKQGKTHELTFEALIKIKDINTTTVEKPNLEGKKVLKEERVRSTMPGIANPKKFVGEYQNDMILEQNGGFVKVGERSIMITHMDENTAEGRYTELMKEGYEEYTSEYPEFTFAAEVEKDSNRATFEITAENENTIVGHIHFDNHSGKIHLNLDAPYRGPVVFDASFNPVLD